MIDYIQCTHCGKRYAASDEIREAEGQFTACQACKEKFLIVVHTEVPESLKVMPEEDVVSTGGWDPSLTMPEAAPEAVSDEAEAEEFLDNDGDGGVQVLQALQVARKKKQRLYILAGLVIVSLLAALWFTLLNEESIKPTERAKPAPVRSAAQIEQSAKVQDANSLECRQAAAQKWILDYRAMHSQYSGEEFVRILKLSEQQVEKMSEFCKNKTIVQDIITAATAKEKPSWLKAEIQMLQDNRKH